ncbi:MAG: hypothetical protein ACK4ON_03755 [Bacteroidia bacterium]
MKNVIFSSLLVVASLISIEANAQCNSFTKTKCVPKVKPYNNIEQMHTTTLLSNDKLKMNMTFYYGDEYRIVVCADEKLGKITMNLKDKSNKVVFTTSGYGSIQWDFNVQATQELTLEVITAPAPKGEELDRSGCVSVVTAIML